ncbi:MAG TPA: hypothetical protein VNV42_01820 [Solirubrobacteraceae bacterium]|jgi:hypothetical protein|nr:hypothetical protein [Solirubrobacteraceae bacterium]
MFGARTPSLSVFGWRLAPHWRGGLGRLAAVTISVVALSSPGRAAAAQHHPRGVFAVFSDCPLGNPAVAQCLVAHITGGEFVLGKEIVPISKTITLQGGLIHAPGPNVNAYVLAGAEDGNTLSRTALNVPGGLLGAGAVTSRTEVTATAELAGPLSAVKLDITNLLEEHGDALTMPLKVKLDNSVLGSNCYLGGEANPVEIELTDGTTSPPPPNRPIAGHPGEEESVVEHGFEAVVGSGASLVNNSFSVPEATGCGGVLGSSIVDAIIGLPSRPGRNTAILDANIDLAEAESVTASERNQP